MASVILRRRDGAWYCLGLDDVEETARYPFLRPCPGFSRAIRGELDHVAIEIPSILVVPASAVRDTIEAENPREFAWSLNALSELMAETGLLGELSPILELCFKAPRRVFFASDCWEDNLGTVAGVVNAFAESLGIEVE